jgi:lactoylglutathione lyase
MLVKIIGFISAILTTTAFLPQVLKTWKTRSTDDLSSIMFGLFSIGIAGWLVYGWLIHDLPMILANSVTICLAGIIMYFIIKKKIIYKIEHLAIYTSDIEVMKNFYVKVFNAKTGKLYINQKNNFSSYFLLLGSGVRLELMHHSNSSPNIGYGHFAVSVGSKNEVNNITEKIRQNGYEIFKEPRITGDGCYESVIVDPEGNKIEITV